MKKTSILLLLLALSTSFVIAQPTQAEIDKMIKDAKAEIDKVKKDPRTAEMAKNLPNLDTLKIISKKDNPEVLKNIKTGTPSSALPARNNKLLGSLPKKNLSRPELVSFLSLLYADLQKKLPVAKVNAAKTIISQLNKDAAKIAGTGVVAWYKSAPAEAALLIVYAASQSPDDITLNNCGAILNLCGLEDKAIPVLKYALANEPTNSTLLNNIGQAFTGLGATDTAMYYFMGCIRQAPTHPEACATVAYIEYEKGNIEKAQEYAEQAIKGGYTPGIAKFYKSIKKDAKLYSWLKNISTEKKYFNLNGFFIPANCRSWEESEDVYAKQQSFFKKVDPRINQFEQVIKQYAFNGLGTVGAAYGKEGPLAKVAQEIKDGINDLYSEEKTSAHVDYVNKLAKTVGEEGNDRLALVNRYVPLFKANEKNPTAYAKLIHQKCLDQVVLDNKWFELRANLTDRYKTAWLERDTRHYDNMVFLTTFTAPDESILQSECASDAILLLNSMKTYVLDNCNPQHKPDCSNSDPAGAEDGNSPEFEVAHCPINLEIPFVGGKMMLNCERFKIDGGEGLLLGYEKNFVTRESTVAIGFGVATHIPGIEYGAREQLFIKFDKNNQPSDLGLIIEAEFDVRGLAPELKTGFTVAMSSGFNHEAGALEGITTENKMNNKVNIYKPESKQD